MKFLVLPAFISSAMATITRDIPYGGFGEAKDIYGQEKEIYCEAKDPFGQEKAIYGLDMDILGLDMDILGQEKAIYGQAKAINGEAKAILANMYKPTNGCVPLINRLTTCKGILPGCIKVTSRDYLKTGLAIRAFRKASKRCELAFFPLCDPIILCTKQTRCKNLAFEKFYHAVLETAKLVSKGKVTCFSKQAQLIIEHIYAAGVKQNASCEELIIFTSTAMHNLYLLTCFPDAGRNTTIGCITRGLMQWLSQPAYTKLSSVSVINYNQKPNALDLFTAETINNEFAAYLKYYHNEAIFGVNSFIYTIKAFNSKEAYLADDRAAYSILKGTYMPTNILEERLLNRFNLYYVLSAKVFNNRKLAAEISEY